MDSHGQPGDPAAGELPRRVQVVRVVVLDAAVLAELAAAVYFANAWRERWDFTAVFCAVFFGLLIPTIAVSRWLGRRRQTRA
jgi:hypothetical protein